MFRTDRPITSGRKSRAARPAARCGSAAKHRSDTRTSYPASSRAAATHATPFGTTGMGCRSRLALTRSTRGLVDRVGAVTVMSAHRVTRRRWAFRHMSRRRVSPQHEQQGGDRPDHGAQKVHDVVVEPWNASQVLRIRATAVDRTFSARPAARTPALLLPECANDGVAERAHDAAYGAANHHPWRPAKRRGKERNEHGTRERREQPSARHGAGGAHGNPPPVRNEARRPAPVEHAELRRPCIRRGGGECPDADGEPALPRTGE